MTQHTGPQARTTRQRRRAFASPGIIRTLAGTVLAVGVVAAIWGVAYDINGATQAQADVVVNRGGFAVVGLCLGVGAVWLRRVLISIAEGRPFESGNAARIAGIGGLVVVASLANDILPVLGSNLVLQRLGLTGSSSPIYAEVVLSLGLLLTVPFLLVLAEAFRRGTELAQDVEGLV